MQELHRLEQYFFDRATIDALATFASGYERPACLCAPTVGAELERRGVDVRVLDVDERFSSLRGFRRFDVFRPSWIEERFGIVVCDPPFFRVSLSQLFAAVRVLSHHETTQPLLLAYLSRRRQAICGTFAPFGLEPTGLRPRYVTVQEQAPGERNEIELFGNLGAEAHARLRALSPGA